MFAVFNTANEKRTIERRFGNILHGDTHTLLFNILFRYAAKSLDCLIIVFVNQRHSWVNMCFFIE